MNDLCEKLSGRFIVIDGPDGVGKSTQLGLLADDLVECGLDVCMVRDPGGTPIGDRIRKILLDTACSEMSVECELMLYMASRAQLAAEVIRPALAEGKCVLGDRYISSTIAYQGAGGLDPESIRRVGDTAVGQTWPDLTVVLDLDAAQGLLRAGRIKDPDRMEARDVEFHKRVRTIFLRQAGQHPGHFVVVNADGSQQDVQQRLRDAIEEWRPKS